MQQLPHRPRCMRFGCLKQNSLRHCGSAGDSGCCIALSRPAVESLISNRPVRINPSAAARTTAASTILGDSGFIAIKREYRRTNRLPPSNSQPAISRIQKNMTSSLVTRTITWQREIANTHLAVLTGVYCDLLNCQPIHADFERWGSPRIKSQPNRRQLLRQFTDLPPGIIPP